MIEIGKTFMFNGIEYRVNFINEKNASFTVGQIDEKVAFHEVGQILKIDEKPYKIIYIHSSKNRISLRLLREEGLNARKSE